MGFNGQAPPVGVLCWWPSNFIHVVCFAFIYGSRLELDIYQTKQQRIVIMCHSCFALNFKDVFSLNSADACYAWKLPFSERAEAHAPPYQANYLKNKQNSIHLSTNIQEALHLLPLVVCFPLLWKIIHFACVSVLSLSQ